MKTIDFAHGVTRYLDSQVIPLFDNPIKRFLAGAVIGFNASRAPEMIEQYRPMLELAGVMRGEEIDIDSLEKFLIAGFAKEPEISLAGIKFKRDDVDVLMTHLRNM